MTKSRMEAFSDGVFAVAITLLVFSLVVPDPARVGAGHLWSEMTARWPQFASYVVTFIIIGIMWVNHHAIFDRVATITRTLLYLNILLLLSIVVLPYATNLLAAFIISSSSANAHTAAAFYSGTMAVAGFAFSLIWMYLAAHRELLTESTDPSFARKELPRFGSGGLIYLLRVGIAFINAVACLVIHALLAAYYVLYRIEAHTGAPETVPLSVRTPDG